MKLNRKHIVGLSTSIAIFFSLMLAVSTRRRSSATMGQLSTSDGDSLDPLLGIPPQHGWPEEFELTNDEDSGLANWLLGVEDHPPMWWTDFWAGLGTLLLAAMIIGALILAVLGGIWVYGRQPLFLLVVPGLPIIALFGHFARDLFWSDAGHKH